MVIEQTSRKEGRLEEDGGGGGLAREGIDRLHVHERYHLLGMQCRCRPRTSEVAKETSTRWLLRNGNCPCVAVTCRGDCRCVHRKCA
jgi:hypothetical protein